MFTPNLTGESTRTHFYSLKHIIRFVICASSWRIRSDKFRRCYPQPPMLRSLTDRSESLTETIREQVTKNQNKIFKSENTTLFFIKESPFKLDGSKVLQASNSSNHISNKEKIMGTGAFCVIFGISSWHGLGT